MALLAGLLRLSLSNQLCRQSPCIQRPKDSLVTFFPHFKYVDCRSVEIDVNVIYFQEIQQILPFYKEYCKTSISVKC